MNKKLLNSKFNYKKISMFCSFMIFGLGSLKAQTCTEPTISAESATNCSGNSVTLSATSDGEDVFWYASQSATNALSEGTGFTTPILNTTTSYWIEAVNYGDGGTSETINNGG